MRQLALLMLLLVGCDGPIRLYRTSIRFPASHAVVVLYCGPDIQLAEAYLEESMPKDRPGLRLTVVEPAADCVLDKGRDNAAPDQRL